MQTVGIGTEAREHIITTQESTLARVQAHPPVPQKHIVADIKTGRMLDTKKDTATERKKGTRRDIGLDITKDITRDMMSKQ